jgi:glycine oxidase
LDTRDALAGEPALNPKLRGAFYDADAYHIHPGRLTQALGQAAARRGVRFQLGTEVVGIERSGARATHVRTATGQLAAGQVVLAAGAWTNACAPWLGFAVPVFPARGQILSVYAVPPPIQAIVFGADAYVFPRVDGTLVVGATVEEVGYDKSLTASGLAWLLGVLPVLCPGLANATFDRAWTGLRPASPDDLPIVGRAPGWDNVILATGHYRNGIMLAPITADLVAPLLLRGEEDPLLAPLSPARFKEYP